MKNIIIGTAGHVDHGKTLLIKALSGIDTDRLVEEKKRGITIELGFAHIPNDAGYNIGVIDVPGHEKFIKNMLAGIGGIDFVLFVVAADEGIMPQTREHFEILKALGIDDGIIVVTKKDMVDPEWLDMVVEDIKEYFKGTFLDGKPLFTVSAKTGENIDELKEAIIEKCDRDTERNEDPELFRLPVDRVFSKQGFGTVITGTLTDGSCRVGDEICIYPEGTKAKIRGIQNYGKESEEAVAGQRTAINLSGVKKDGIDRGDVIAAPGAVSVTSMIDVALEIFSDTDKSVINNSRLHIYSGSKEALCKVVLLDRDTVMPGETAYAQLRLEEPMALKRGDRFIVRFYSPIITIGGGRVIDVLPEKHKRNREDVLKNAAIMDRGDLREIVVMKTNRWKYYGKDEIEKELGLKKGELSNVIEEAVKAGELTELSGGVLLGSEKYEFLRNGVRSIICDFHEKNPLFEGMQKQELLSRLAVLWHLDDEKRILSILEKLEADGEIKFKGKTVALGDFKIEYTDEQLKLKDKIEKMYADAGIDILKNDEVYSEIGDANVAAAMMDDLIDEGKLVKLSVNYNMEKGAWEKVVATTEELGAKGPFTVAELRDALGSSRKYVIPLSDALDRAGITVFNGETRSLLPKK